MSKLLKFSLAILIAAVAVSPAYAAKAQIRTLHSGTPHQAFFDIDFEGERGFAVGAGGSVFFTSDAGKTWSGEQTPNRMALLGVAVSAGRVVAVGQMGTIVVRQSDGNWTQVDSGTTERLFKVDMNRSGVAVAVGSFGTVLRSSDHGHSWERAMPSWKGIFEDPEMRLGGFFEPSVYGVQIDDSGRVWACGELSLIMSSEDGGLTWSIDNAGGSTLDGVSPTLSDLVIREDGVGFAVGQEGFALKTKDKGQSWAPLILQTNSNLLAVTSKSNGLVVVTGMRHMRMSFDNGEGWFSIRGSDISSGWYGGVAFPSTSEEAIAVGHQSRILQLGFKD